MDDRIPEPAASSLPATFCEHERWLRTLALARVRDANVVDDILQNVAMALVCAQRQATVIRQVGPWLYRVLVRQCLLYQRQQGRGRRLWRGLQSREDESSAVASAGDPLEWLLAEERRVLVRRSLDALPWRDAEVLLLKYSEGWSYRQIADHLGVSATTIESRLHRARQRLRDRLAMTNLTEVTR